MSSSFKNSVLSNIRSGVGAVTRPAARCAAVFVLSAAVLAQGGMAGGIMAPSASVKPPALKNVGIEQRLNEQVPLDLAFRDESGKPVHIGDYLGKKPVILSLVYYRCPMLCSELLTGLESSLKVLKFDVGNEFDVLTVSFDPSDTPEAATSKKAEILKRYKRAGAENGWHFLTGSQESIAALTKAVGFSYDYDAKNGQFSHATAIMVLTPEGKISQYYYGVEFSPKDLRLGLIQASDHKIGNLADQVLLYCYHYDPNTGKYSAVIGHIIQLSGGATILGLGAMLMLLFRRGSDSEHRRQGGSPQYVR